MTLCSTEIWVRRLTRTISAVEQNKIGENSYLVRQQKIEDRVKDLVCVIHSTNLSLLRKSCVLGEEESEEKVITEPFSLCGVVFIKQSFEGDTTLLFSIEVLLVVKLWGL